MVEVRVAAVHGLLDEALASPFTPRLIKHMRYFISSATGGAVPTILDLCHPMLRLPAPHSPLRFHSHFLNGNFLFLWNSSPQTRDLNFLSRGPPSGAGNQAQQGRGFPQLKVAMASLWE